MGNFPNNAWWIPMFPKPQTWPLIQLKSPASLTNCVLNCVETIEYVLKKEAWLSIREMKYFSNTAKIYH